MQRFKLLPKPVRAVLPTKLRFGFDFDGTCTDGDAERPIYIEAFKGNLRGSLKHPEAFDRMWDPTQAAVSADLSGHGWIIDGKNVCPAHTDGIIFCQAAGRPIILADAAQSVETIDEKALGNALSHLYKTSYVQIVPKSVFRKGLVGFLNHTADISGEAPFVLTNSSTDAVSAKVALLRASILGESTIPDMPIHGAAQKFVLDPSLTHLPEFIDLPSGRVYVQRGIYIRKLAELFGDVDPAETCYIGDSLHLDGVGALFSGRIFFFVPNHETPRAEIEYVLNHPRGFVLDSFDLV